MSEWHADFELLRTFSRQGDQQAFATLTRRHLDLVYATALRKVTDGGGAEEICQNVFGALARKAWQFAPDDSLPSWLHRTTLLESKSWLRGELRRRRREETAAELGTTMNTPEDQPAFSALVPLLDEALLSLREKDRTALLLRFYESHSLREVGAAVGVSEDAARMRVQSALEKVAEFFKRHGFKTATVAATAAALQHTATTASAAVAAAVVNAALQAAPPALVGLKALLARLASLTKAQKAALCIALAVLLLFWLWRDQRRAAQRPKAQPIATQLAAKRNDTINLETNNERIMKTMTPIQFSLLLLSNGLLMASNALAQSAGQIVAWGRNYEGQANVPAAAQSGEVAIAVGYLHMVALKNDGSVVAWGENDSGQTTVPPAAQSGVKAIAASAGHNLALKNDGTVVAWGNNYYGQTNVPVAAQSGVTAIATSFDGHLVALKDDGSVVAWGRNDYGQTNVPAAAQSGVKAIAVGYDHTLALKDDGSVLAWGFNSDGQTNVPVAAQSGVTAIAAGLYHTVALKDDGSVLAWGSNSDGQTTVPAGLSRVTTVAAGGWNTVALLAGGSEMPVSLALRPSGNEMIVSWPTNATGFTLQSTQTITPPGPWSDVTNPPAVTSGQFTVTNPISNPAQFFRLKKP